MVTLQTAENALKEVYLGVVANQINIASSPLLARIKRTSKDIFGKEIVKAAPVGVNGGFGAGGETDALPIAVDPNYVQFRSAHTFGVVLVGHQLRTPLCHQCDTAHSLGNDIDKWRRTIG